MHSSVGQIVIYATPVVVIVFFSVLAWLDRRKAVVAAGPGFFQRNGYGVGAFLLIAVGFWTIFMIVLPLMAMVDLSFRPRLPPPQWGGPRDYYTLENYQFFLYGSNFSRANWNVVHMQAFALTILNSIIITLINFIICYPIAYYMAKVAKAGRLRLMLLLLIAPYWVNEILRAFAFRILFAQQGILNNALVASGLVSEPIDFFASNIALYSGLTYAYLLMMMFALYNAIETLDTNQIEAARDLGAPWWHIHLFIVLPHAKPGIASGSTLVFMLTAGALAAPQVLGGPRTLWFTPIVYDRFYQAFNWQQGAAYALILLLACIIFVFGVMRLFKVSLAEITR